MCGDYNLRREKRYVEVDVRFTPDGKIRPLAINYDKAHTYGIDRVLAVKHGTSRLGGKGHCFTCLICGQKRNLWLEQGKWFVEALLFRAGKLCFVMAKYLSRTDLSHIAGRYIEQYYNFFGISKDAPEPIDPERLASSVLGLNVKMLPLCSDGSVLGLTVFQKCGFTVTLGDGTKLVEVFMPKDVVIDSALAADSCTGCRNFTIAHEAAHHILADQFPNDYGKAVKCRGHIAYRERNGQPSWEEWQANTLAAELLMPTFLVNAEIERAALCLPNGILYKSASDPNYERILEMAARIGVSWSAIRIRLQQMQVINGKPIHCRPLDVIRFGE